MIFPLPSATPLMAAIINHYHFDQTFPPVYSQLFLVLVNQDWTINRVVGLDFFKDKNDSNHKETTIALLWSH